MRHSIKREVLIPFLLLSTIFLIAYSASAQLDTQAEIDSLTIAYDDAEELEERRLILKTLSVRYQDKGNWEKYEDVVEQMLLSYEEDQDSFYLAETYNKLGISNCILGQNTKALAYFEKALEINLAQGMNDIAANSYENLGVVYNDMADFDKAVECQLNSLELRKGSGSNRIFNNYVKLAMLHEQIGDIEKEDEFLALAKEEMQKQDSVTPRNKALFYNQLGDIYSQRGMSDSSIVCYRRVILFSNQIGWKRGTSSGLGSLAEVHYEDGALDSSIYYHKQSLKLAEEIEDGIGTTEEYRHIAKLYNELGKHDSVLYYANAALQKAVAFDMLEEQSDVLKFLADYYRSRRDFEQAYTLLQQHHVALDSISSAEVKKNVAELDAKYETKVKEQQIELLTAENEIKNQRMVQAWLFIGFLLILVAFGLALLYFRRRKAAFKQSELQQQLLRSQMNPHFIFNVMGSIQSYLYKNEAKKAADYLSRFAALSRSVLEFSSRESITLKEEIEMLQNYIELQKAGMEKPFEVEYLIDEDMETDFIQIPPMLLQPFIENAIKHGLKDLDYQGKLSLSFKETGDFIAVEIVDNGAGLTQQPDNKHKSMAIEIFRQRKKGIEHKFKKDLTFEFQNLNTSDKSKHGVRVYFQLPILNND